MTGEPMKAEEEMIRMKYSLAKGLSMLIKQPIISKWSLLGDSSEIVIIQAEINRCYNKCKTMRTYT
jgi:hypothetical protein